MNRAVGESSPVFSGNKVVTLQLKDLAIYLGFSGIFQNARYFYKTRALNLSMLILVIVCQTTNHPVTVGEPNNSNLRLLRPTKSFVKKIAFQSCSAVKEAREAQGRGGGRLRQQAMGKSVASSVPHPKLLGGEGVKPKKC